MKQISLILFLAIALQGIYAQNSFLAYDGFAETANLPLQGGAGGQGWSAPWSVQNQASNGYAYLPASLTFAALQKSGGKLAGGDSYLTSGRNLDVAPGGAFDAYVSGDNGIGSGSSKILWMSVLLSKNNDNDQSVYLDLHNSNIPWCNNCTSQRIGVGYFGSNSNVGSERRWSLRIGTEVYTTAIPVQTNATVLLVVKLSFGLASTQADLFVNPTNIGSSGIPVTADISQATSAPFRFRAVAAYLGDQTGNGFADEFRLASSYPVVVPDNTVVINLPPVGAFSLTEQAGEAPLLVSVDAGSAYDPEGGALSYTWNWGDGSAKTTGVIAAHTYAKGLMGVVTVELEVKDILGLKGSTTKKVTLYQPGTTAIPCQSTVTQLAEAACGKSNGAIRVGAGLAANVAYDFINSSGTSISPSSSNEFSGLAAGTYFLTVTGSNQCKDVHELTITTDSTTCAGWNQSLCAMELGVNVNGLADWSREHAFVNRYKHVRADLITFNDGCNCWNSNMEGEILLDAAGYPLQIPQVTSSSPNTKVRFILSADGGNLRANEQYVFLYEGSGSLTLLGATTEENTPGRLQFSVPANSGNIWLDVQSSTLGDHLRNFRLLLASEENLDLAANTFNPVFISRLSPFTTIRFMDWGATNNSQLTKWEQRSTVNQRTYAGAKGVPYEMMIKLANQAQKDLWICVPHQADSSYIAEMAKLFRDNVNPNRKIYLEYSNEVWNWLFEQAQYNNVNRPLNLNYGRAYAEKAKRVFESWHKVFAGQSSRVIRVLGLQAGYNDLNTEIMAQLTKNDWDLGSPTYYFGLDHSASGNPVLSGSSNGEDVNRNARNAMFGAGGFMQSVKQDYRNIKVFGKQVVSYEGGPHYTDFQQHPYQQAMYDAQYLASMYRLYDEVLDTIRTMGNKLAMSFTLSGLQESVYGSWGHLPDMYLTTPYHTSAPKYQAILDNSCLPFKTPVLTPAVQVIAPQVIGKPGQTVWMDISVRDFITIVSGQFTISFDTAVVKFDSVKVGNIPGMSVGNFGTSLNIVNKGKVILAYTVPTGNLVDGLTVPDGTTFFRLGFKINPKAKPGQSSVIAFDDSFAEIEFLNKNGLINLIQNNGKVSVDNSLSVDADFRFEARVIQKNSALLSWQDVSNQNSFGYLIERSLDGQHYDALAFVSAQSIPGKVQEYIDPNLTVGIYYYRLRVIAKDQSFEYSPVRSLIIDYDNGLMVIPNPVGDWMFIRAADLDQPYSITNQLGQIVKSGSVLTSELGVSDLNPGIYYLRSNGQVVKFVKVN